MQRTRRSFIPSLAESFLRKRPQVFLWPGSVAGAQKAKTELRTLRREAPRQRNGGLPETANPPSDEKPPASQGGQRSDKLPETPTPPPHGSRGLRAPRTLKPKHLGCAVCHQRSETWGRRSRRDRPAASRGAHRAACSRLGCAAAIGLCQQELSRGPRKALAVAFIIVCISRSIFAQLGSTEYQTAQKRTRDFLQLCTMSLLGRSLWEITSK